MNNITGNDIAELSDEDLRSLIGLLCEADLRSVGIPTAGVTWGGHQNAKDGGIDVRVEVSCSVHKDSFIPRSITCFQVKKPDMHNSAIKNEMCPNGNLRQVIQDLVNTNGAYIIVSSKGSTSDSSLMSRREAMQQAVSDCPNSSKIKLDFYDRERVAAWVRSHPSIILWVRNKVGRPIQGWRTYDNWARTPGGTEEEYMLDNNVHLYNDGNFNSDGLSTVEGINKLRAAVSCPTSTVRLVGLSGVGKTRLLQALFDQRIGENPLNRDQVFYCDISDNPNPDPKSLAESLITLQKPAILAIDNCPPDLHRRLTSVCVVPSSLVRLITVEYDVREDQPEETEVFRLEPASLEIIEKIICIRYKHISKVDAYTIAKFSGGNARIAIALANTVPKGGDLANIRDEDLFIRLFQQRNETDNDLLKTAQVCSLVYSFDCEITKEKNSELKLLGSLIGMSEHQIYANVSKLKRRDLVQQRGRWRAVLPHAIANKLAKRAFEDLPMDSIYAVFEKGGSDRLLKSFSRRLSYLHRCNAAIEISKKWLSYNGLLEDIRHLNKFQIELLKNIAPINPELVLFSIEKVLNYEEAEEFFSRNNYNYIEFTRILRALAYDKELFERSVELLIKFALTEDVKENNNSIRSLLKSLFQIWLSGTHATPKQRLAIISSLVHSTDDKKVDLGISLLDAALESLHFVPYDSFQFGARSRDYGFTPKSGEEFNSWYKMFIEYCVTIATSNEKLSDRIKTILGKKFRTLWVKAKGYDELENATIKIINTGEWNAGLVAVMDTKKFDGKEMKPEILYRLNNLHEILMPKTLINRAKLYAFSIYLPHFESDDLLESKIGNDNYDSHKPEEIALSIGKEVGANYEIFKELLTDLLSKDSFRLFYFGQGLAYGVVDFKKMWNDFCEQLSYIEESKQNYNVIRGFLSVILETDPILYEKFLDEALTNKVLAAAYPWLQLSFEVNSQGIERIKKSLEFGMAQVYQYMNLAYVEICDEKLCELLRVISYKDNGLEVSIEILHTKLDRDNKVDNLSSSVISLGQELLINYQFTRNKYKNRRMDYELGEIIKRCFTGKSAEGNAGIICKKIFQAWKEYNINSLDYDDVIKALAIIQPKVFLDMFLEEGIKNDYDIERMFSVNSILNVYPLTYINEDLIINWCEIDPEIRYPVIAPMIIPFQKNEKNDELEWRPFALKIIYNSHNTIMVLDKFSSIFRPNSWSGSRAEIMQSRLCLISSLKTHEDPLISEWACKEEKTLENEICSTREWEFRNEIEHNECFEY